MLPLKAPLPTAWNLPFHPAAGSHTTILMSESLDGLSVAATRQNAGSVPKTRALPAPPGGLNAPAATRLASVTDPFGIASEASCSHGVPAACGRVANRMARTAAARQPFRILMASPSWGRILYFNIECDVEIQDPTPKRITPSLLSRDGKRRGPGCRR